MTHIKKITLMKAVADEEEIQLVTLTPKPKPATPV